MSVTTARGFRASGVAAGLRSTGALDVALVVNDGPLDVVAATYTSNRCQANPVQWSMDVTADGCARAVVLNAGGANCYTGRTGYDTTVATAEQVATQLRMDADQVVVCSTGLIGVPLDRDLMLTGVDRAVDALGLDGGEDAAAAIMTTDTKIKIADVESGGFRVGGMAKGAGMLAPALATMLVVITTDAVVDAAIADLSLREACRVTFDRLDSDGCQSTNDTVVLMASGASGVGASLGDFTDALIAVCRDLAAQLIADAEGSEHDIAINVTGAASEDDALEAGRAVARSNLVKTAIFGRDPNWGRILAAVGTTSAAFDPAELDVTINGVMVCRDGGIGDSRDDVDLGPRAVEIVIDLKAGSEAATIWTNDLTNAYVRENSAYSS
jgi:glutamate N-acetyltransferase/amino-acid N-acetyltransferase